MLEKMPQTREFLRFRSGKMVINTKFSQVLKRIINNLNTFETTAAPFLKKLGQLHINWGVRVQYFEVFLPIFLMTISVQIKAELTKEEKLAWTKLYNMLTSAMLGDKLNDDLVCDLCERAQPMFLFGFNNEIMRMQDRHLPDFLKSLK